MRKVYVHNLLRLCVTCLKYDDNLELLKIKDAYRIGHRIVTACILNFCNVSSPYKLTHIVMNLICTFNRDYSYH